MSSTDALTRLATADAVTAWMRARAQHVRAEQSRA